MGFSLRRSVRFSRFILAATLLPAMLLHGAMPIAFGQEITFGEKKSGISPGDAIWIYGHRFSGSARPNTSVWFRFVYPGGDRPGAVASTPLGVRADIKVEWLAAAPFGDSPGDRTSLYIYTLDPPLDGIGVWRSDGSPPLRQVSIDDRGPKYLWWNYNGQGISFRDPKPQELFLEFRNRDVQTLSFEGYRTILRGYDDGSGDDIPANADREIPVGASRGHANAGPSAESPHSAITVDDGRFVGTITPYYWGNQPRPHKVWYRFYYAKPGTTQRVCAKFIQLSGAWFQDATISELEVLKLYVGSDPSSLAPATTTDFSVGDGERQGERYTALCKSVSLPTAQFIYFVLANDTDHALAYAGTIWSLPPDAGRGTSAAGHIGPEVPSPTTVVDAQLDLSRLGPDVLPAATTPPTTPPVTPASPPATQPATNPASPPVASPATAPVAPGKPPAAMPATQPASPGVEAQRTPRVTPRTTPPLTPPTTVPVTPATPPGTPPDPAAAVTVAPAPAPTEPTATASDLANDGQSLAQEEPPIDEFPAMDDSPEEGSPE